MNNSNNDLVFVPMTKQKKRPPRRLGWVMCCLLAALPGAEGVLAAISSTSTAWPGGRWNPDPQVYGMSIERDVPILMDDGVKLFANIAYPSDPQSGERVPGPFPVILTQNGYIGNGEPDPFFVSRGYIHAVADTRGSLRSEAPGNGPLVADFLGPRMARDGVALTHWAALLQGSNGVVGLSGCSALGIIQINTAAMIGPNSPIKAIAPACASNGYETYMPGGVPSPVVNFFPFSLDVNHYAENAAWGLEFLIDITSAGPRAYNGKFWHERSTSLRAPDVVRNGIPALLWSGWAALEVTGAIEMYAIFQNAAAERPPYGPMKRKQAVSTRYQIVVGPGGHGQGLDKTIELEWFDHWLKGQDTGIDKVKTPMHLYELGSNRWVNTARLPIVRGSSPFFLVAPGKLSNKAVPSPGRDALRWAAPSEVDGKLVYDAKPFNRDWTIAGPVAASLWASSSNTNMQLTATLFDVAPNGTATEITFGALLGSMRALDQTKTWRGPKGHIIRPEHTFTTDTYLVPGKIQRFDIKLNPVLYAVEAGHALRLTISTQTDPTLCLLQLSSLGAARQCVYTAPQLSTLPGGRYLVHRGRKTPSMITIPLINPDRLPTVWSDYTVTSPAQTQALDWGPARD